MSGETMIFFPRARRLLPIPILAMLFFTSCAGPGTVVDRKPCKTSECIYVRQRDGSVQFEMISVGSYPKCRVDASWPECKQ